MAHDIYYPGWVAEVDGRPARVLRANVLFRGVEVSEGRHVVVFRFEPFSVANLRNAVMGLFAAPAEGDRTCSKEFRRGELGQ